jgi:hypothetical protein
LTAGWLQCHIPTIRVVHDVFAFYFNDNKVLKFLILWNFLKIHTSISIELF